MPRRRPPLLPTTGRATYAQASAWAKAQGITTARKWLATSRPACLPSNPNKVYPEWTGWGAFTGTLRAEPKAATFVPYAEAQAWAREHNITTKARWNVMPKPAGIPAAPNIIYADQWAGWGEFLGTGRKASRHTVMVPYATARAWALARGIRTQRAWYAAIRDEGIPAAPDKAYADVWAGWPSFLAPDQERPDLQAVSA